ncbi:MAG TPA: winged helix-turn-helix transcriptional regulator [Nitrososphaeraceae archaeon]
MDKVEQIQEESRRKSTFREENMRKREAEILKILIEYSNSGIHHIELAKKIGIDRKNLAPYMTKLIAKGLIRRESGRQGKYFPTDLAYRDTRLTADVFGRKFRSSILKNDEIITTNKRTEFDDYYCIDFTIYKKYFEPKFTEEDRIEHTLFEFSNKIGAFITFTLIQAMSLDNKHLIFSNENIARDELIQEWIKIAMMDVIPALAWEFRIKVYKSLDKFPKDHNSKLKFLSKRPRLLFSKEDSRVLSGAFTRIYTLLSYELENILKELPNATDSFKAQLEYMKQKRAREL